MNIPRHRLILEAIYERDVDLILVEELHSSNAFCRLFFELAFVAKGAARWTDDTEVIVRHSLDYVGGNEVVDELTGETMPSHGETDIEVLMTSASMNTSTLLLIENKIDAPFMPNQPERYQGRAAAKLRAGECAIAKTVLVAPFRYIESATAAAVFDARISYEMLASYFAARANDACDLETQRRSEYRQMVLEHAIHQFRRGGGPTVVHPAVTDFRMEYYKHAQREAPSLQMQAPNPNGQWAGDAWIEFRHALGKHPGLKVDIVHKLPQERVDLQLYGWAAHEHAVRNALEQLLDDGMFVPSPKRGTKSLAVAINVPRIDHQGKFEPQREAVEAGLSAALRLQDWYRRNLSSLQFLINGLHNPASD